MKIWLMILFLLISSNAWAQMDWLQNIFKPKVLQFDNVPGCWDEGVCITSGEWQKTPLEHIKTQYRDAYQGSYHYRFTLTNGRGTNTCKITSYSLDLKNSSGFVITTFDMELPGRNGQYFVLVDKNGNSSADIILKPRQSWSDNGTVSLSESQWKEVAAVELRLGITKE